MSGGGAISGLGAADATPATTWTRNDKIGLVLVITALVILTIATCLTQGVFDKSLHLSSANILGGSLGVVSLIPLIAGMVLLCKPCAQIRGPKTS